MTQLRDEAYEAPVRGVEALHAGPIFDVVRERVDLGAAGEVTREIVRHKDAVAVVAMDEHERVLLIQQYRHPVSLREWELPAGLLDVEGEPPVAGAKRELWEEADVAAGTWHVLVEYLSSSGFTDEKLTVFLARNVHDVPVDERFTREGEELDITTRWVPIDDVHEAILRGDLKNAPLIVGVLATMSFRARSWTGLREA